MATTSKSKPATTASAAQGGAIGIEELIGQTVVIIGAIYIYTGKLVGVGPEAVKLEDAEIVYETGPWAGKSWADAQRLPWSHTYVSRGMIESFGAR